MLTLSQASIIEKNKVSTDGVWLMLLDVQLDNGDVIRLVNNIEDINFRGDNYIAFPFTLEDISEDGKELPNVQLQVSNATGTMQRLIEEHNGLGDTHVVVRVINTNVPNVAEIEENFIVTGSSADNMWVTLTLGTDFSQSKRFPPIRVMKDYCPFKFKGVECGYKGRENQCNKTLKRCRELNNSVRFGGEPTIPQGGVYESNS